MSATINRDWLGSAPFNGVVPHAPVLTMIKSFKHKGLEAFFLTGDTRGIQFAHARKLRLQLAALDTAAHIEDLNIPGYRLHQLKGDRKGNWSITINGNWRLTFNFYDGDAYIDHYEDYH